MYMSMVITKARCCSASKHSSFKPAESIPFLNVTTSHLRSVEMPLMSMLVVARVCWCLQCFDTVGWAAGRASGLQKN